MSRTLYGKLSPWAKTRLVTEVLVTYFPARRKLARAKLPQLLADLRRPRHDGREARELQGSDKAMLRHARAARLGWVVRRTLGALPADAACLVQSIVLISMLEKRGIENALVIGVAPGTQFAAHAWVEHRGEPLLPASEGVYERLTEL